MAKNNYKYLIREKLAEYNTEDCVLANRFLMDYLHISHPTWTKYKDIRSDEGADIPAMTLLKLAQFFECKPMELVADNLDYTKMVNDFNELRDTKYPHYVFSRKFTK